MTKLTPELLLFEVACMLSRHGIPASSDNPTAAVGAATAMLRALGVPVDAPEPLAISATAAHPIVEPPPAGAVELPRRQRVMPEPSPLARFTPGQAPHPGGQHRVLRLAPEGGAS